MKRRGDLLSAVILLAASLLGVWAFLHPMAGGGPPEGAGGPRAMAHSADAPLIFVTLLALCLLVLVANLETRRVDARLVSVLGVLVGITACLRLVSGPMGSSAFFILPIVCGYVFGAEFGFLLAALAMLTSALLTGGVGPWLPFQMFAAGWCGMISGWLPRLSPPRAKWLLTAWGAVAGLLFGAMINLWFWPFLQPADPSLHYEPGLAVVQTAIRYAAFYLATSIWWDAGRALANAILLFVLTEPLMELLTRFQKRFRFELESG
ncbi:MAG: ECF transporter S component [Acidobacteriota bacterium]